MSTVQQFDDPITHSVAPIPPLARLRELRAMPYRQYLRTPEWLRTRAQALERAGHGCQVDPAHAGAIHVHHAKRDRVGAELPADLTVLCDACHELHHGAGVGSVPVLRLISGDRPPARRTVLDRAVRRRR